MGKPYFEASTLVSSYYRMIAKRWLVQIYYRAITAQLVTLFTLSNLWRPRRHLLANVGVVPL